MLAGETKLLSYFFIYRLFVYGWAHMCLLEKLSYFQTILAADSSVIIQIRVEDPMLC